MSITLFEHNADAYHAALTMLRETGKAAVIRPLPLRLPMVLDAALPCPCHKKRPPGRAAKGGEAHGRAGRRDTDGCVHLPKESISAPENQSRGQGPVSPRMNGSAILKYM